MVSDKSLVKLNVDMIKNKTEKLNSIENDNQIQNKKLQTQLDAKKTNAKTTQTCKKIIDKNSKTKASKSSTAKNQFVRKYEKNQQLIKQKLTFQKTKSTIQNKNLKTSDRYFVQNKPNPQAKQVSKRIKNKQNARFKKSEV